MSVKSCERSALDGDGLILLLGQNVGVDVDAANAVVIHHVSAGDSCDSVQLLRVGLYDLLAEIDREAWSYCLPAVIPAPRSNLRLQARMFCFSQGCLLSSQADKRSPCDRPAHCPFSK